MVRVASSAGFKGQHPETGFLKVSRFFGVIKIPVSFRNRVFGCAAALEIKLEISD